MLAPLENLIVTNFHSWLQRLPSPDRTGTHNQTAFALGLALDWAQSNNDRDFAKTIGSKARQFYLHDGNYPWQIEPIAYDFLSPGLAEADLMRRILSTTDFALWLTSFLPQLHPAASQCWQPMQVLNPHDYMQAHFRGLNLSRAWMLEGISAGLPIDDDRRPHLQALADLHWQHASSDVTSDCYASSHWVGTFAVYLLTARGI